MIQARRISCMTGCTSSDWGTVASWTGVAQPTAPTTATKLPDVAAVCTGAVVTLSGPATDGNAGLSCSIEYRFSTNGGTSWSSASTTIPSFAAGMGTDTNLIQARRSSCLSGCTTTSWNTIATWTGLIGPTPPTSITGVIKICSGSTTTLTATGGSEGNGATYQWGTGTVVGSYIISGATSVSYTTPALTANASYWVRRVGVVPCDIATSGVSTNVTVLPIPTSSISGTTTVCYAASAPSIVLYNPQILPVTVTYNINGGSNLTKNINGSGTSSLLVSTTTVGAFTYHLVSVVYQTTPTCLNSLTDTARVTVTPTVGSPTTPTSAASEICQGSSNTIFTTTANYATTYLWTLTGAGSSTISGTGTSGTVAWDPAFSGIATITVKANGCNSSMVPPSNASVTIRPTPTATISGSTTVFQNAAAPDITFTNPQALPEIVTYNVNGGTNNTVSVGANATASQSVATGTQGIFAYNLVSVVYETAPECANNLTGTATVNVIAPSDGGILSGGISPICGGITTGVMTLNNYVGSIDHWEKRVDGGSWTTIPNTATTYSEIPGTAGAWDYRVAVQSNTLVYSTVVSIIVTPAPEQGMVADNQTICVGIIPADLVFSGSGNIQWQSSDNEGFASNITDISGANSQTLAGSQMSNLVKDTWYRVKVTSGICTPFYSTPKKITVNSLSSEPTGISAVASTLCQGTSTTLYVDTPAIAKGGLIDYSKWTVGTGSATNFGQNGVTAENSRILGTDPFGNQAVIWESKPDGISVPNGGWNTSPTSINNMKLYRFSVWVNRTVMGNDALFYFGCNSNSGVMKLSDGTISTNPFFWTSSNPPVNELPEGEWVLVVGHIYPQNYSGSANNPESGRYTVSGGRIGDISNDFKWLPTTVSTTQRVYLYNGFDVNVRQQMVYPRIDVVDGTEPSVNDLLKGFDSRNTLGTGGQWKWYSGTCGSNYFASGPTVVVSPIINTDYFVRAEGTCNTPVNCKSIHVEPAAPATPGAISGISMQSPGLSGQTYSISAVLNAMTYTWTVPTGWTITAGQGTSIITVTTGASGQDGKIYVKAGNSCGISAADSLVVTLNGFTPGAVGSSQTICFNTAPAGFTNATLPIGGNGTYNYQWQKQPNCSGNWGDIAGATETTYQSGSLVQTMCFRRKVTSVVTIYSNVLTVVVNSTPVTPLAISGPAVLSAGLNATYSVNTVFGGVTYNWTVPNGWIITSQQTGTGISLITVTAGVVGNNGNVTVSATNGCGTSTPSTLAVEVSECTPGFVGNAQSICTNTVPAAFINLSLATGSGPTYQWQKQPLCTGVWTDISGATETTYSETASLSQTTCYRRTVNSGSCTQSTIAVKVTVQIPPTVPDSIFGASSQCSGASGETYSIIAIPGAVTYTWTLPAGWAITGGLNTTNIIVTTGTTSGDISVTAGNSCYTSAPKTLAVVTMPGTPIQPGNITGNLTLCPGVSSQIYSIDSVSNAVGYIWTVPTGWTITGGYGTKQIYVTPGLAGSTGFITVAANNFCGTGASSALAVMVVPGAPNAPVAITASNSATNAIQANWSASAYATKYFLDVASDNAFTALVSGYNYLDVGNNLHRIVYGLASNQIYYYRVRAFNDCGTSVSSNTISDTTLSSTTTTVYTWTVPSGFSITSGQGTPSIITETGTSGGYTEDVTVTASNSCGASLPKTFSVAIGVKPDPVTVTGDGNSPYCGRAILIASGGNNGTMYWQSTTANGTIDTVPTNRDTVYASGRYYFRSRSADGCWSDDGSDTVVVTYVGGINDIIAINSALGEWGGYLWQGQSNTVNWGNVNWYTFNNQDSTLTPTLNKPDSTVDVAILAGSCLTPVVELNDFRGCRNLIIGDGATLLLDGSGELHIKGNLNIDGYFNVNASLDKTGHVGDIPVEGDVFVNENSTMLVHGFDAGASKLIMTGAGIQKITSAGYPLNDLTIRKANSSKGMGDDEVILSDPATVSGTLSLEGRRLNMNGNNLTMENKEPTAIVNPDINGHIGYILQDLTAQVRWKTEKDLLRKYTVPFGRDDDKLIPITLDVSKNNTDPSAIPYITYNTWPGHKQPDIILPGGGTFNYDINRKWYIGKPQQDNGSGTNGTYAPSAIEGLITMTYVDDEIPPEFDTIKVMAQRWNPIPFGGAGTWAEVLYVQDWEYQLHHWMPYIGGGVRKSPLPGEHIYSYTTGNVEGYLFWDKWALTAFDNPLPIELLYFDAKCHVDMVEVKWATATETNSNTFTVEKSNDAALWKVISVVQGANNSSTQKNYTVNDKSPFDGVSYYRLTQTDNNGLEKQYGPVVVTCMSNNSPDAAFYPNPFSNTLNISFSNISASDAQVQVYDVLGKLVKTKNFINIMDGQGNIVLDMGSLSSGVYFVKFIANDFVKYEKVTKER